MDGQRRVERDQDPELALEGQPDGQRRVVVICAPEELGLRLTTGNNPISSNDFDRAGLVEVDGGWETPELRRGPGPDGASNVSANAGSVSLNPSEPCTRP